MFFGSRFSSPSSWRWPRRACGGRARRRRSRAAIRCNPGHVERRDQQHLGIVEYVARHADAGEQAHRLDMIAVAQQNARMSFSEAASSPSQNRPVAVMTSGGIDFSFFACAAATRRCSSSPTIL